MWVWDLAFQLNEEIRLGTLKNRVLRRVFGTEEEEVAGGRRELHELLNLHFLLDMIGKIKDNEVPGGRGGVVWVCDVPVLEEICCMQELLGHDWSGRTGHC